MSRFIKNTITVPSAVSISIGGGGVVTAQGPCGVVRRKLHSPQVEISCSDGALTVGIKNANDSEASALAGTFWRVLDGMVAGTEKGVFRVLELVGVGYRAQLAGNEITMQLGFSRPIRYTLPEGVKANLPSPTEIVLEGADKYLVGQTAANLRATRPPEPYKGKGVRYRGERVIIKETKKK